MTKKIISFILIALFFTAINPAWAAEEALMRVVERLTKKSIVAWAKNPVVVNAVEEANKEAEKPLDEIMRLDKKWQATEGVDEWIGGFLNNPCADYLKKIQAEATKEKISLYGEIFVMDKQGCIVAESGKTTDYWQGDEDKFVKSFAGGKGANFIDEPMFDDSSGTYSIQVSVPVLDPRTKEAIGAMTVGINLDALAEQTLY